MGDTARQGAERAGLPPAGGTYLDLEYRNINTSRVLFSHQYQLQLPQRAPEVLEASSLDLLRVLERPDATPGWGWPRMTGR